MVEMRGIWEFVREICQWCRKWMWFWYCMLIRIINKLLVSRMKYENLSFANRVGSELFK